MRLNNNKFFLTIFIALLVSIIFISVKIYNFTDSNILNYMKDVRTDKTIMSVYQSDFNEIAVLMDASTIVKYVDVDLNGDGQMDKIVVIRSAIHSGSQGDMFEILLNDSGTFNRIYTGVIRLYSQEWEVVGSVKVSDVSAGEFKSIKINTGYNQIILGYKNGVYTHS